MKAVLDVHYNVAGPAAACVAFDDWQGGTPIEIFWAILPAASEYRAGKFYERELPSLLSVLQHAGREFDTIIIDGYVHLKPGGGKGLGAYLFDSLSYSPVVIGVAKNLLAIADRFMPIIRGRSSKPLFISAIGCTVQQAARLILDMHGPYRIPTLLKLADRHARSG